MTAVGRPRQRRRHRSGSHHEEAGPDPAWRPLFPAYAVGTPGFGIDTRTGSSALLGAIYSIAVFTLLLALGASSKWPRAAAWLALLGGAFAVALPALDLTCALAGPPPGAMVVLDVAILALGLAILWRRWPATRVAAAAPGEDAGDRH